MNSLCVTVTGIANKQMKTSVKNALDKIEGVQSVDVDRTLGNIEVGFNEPADKTKIIDCIESCGLRLA